MRTSSFSKLGRDFRCIMWYTRDDSRFFRAVQYIFTTTTRRGSSKSFTPVQLYSRYRYTPTIDMSSSHVLSFLCSCQASKISEKNRPKPKTTTTTTPILHSLIRIYYHFLVFGCFLLIILTFYPISNF